MWLNWNEQLCMRFLCKDDAGTKIEQQLTLTHEQAYESDIEMEGCTTIYLCTVETTNFNCNHKLKHFKGIITT